MSIIWEEPAGNAHGGNRGKDYSGIEAALRSNPGRWAIVATGMSASMTAGLKKAKMSFNPPEDFEFTSRDIVKGVAAKIYGRYVGPIS